MENTNTFARDYRVLVAATQPARSRLLADSRVTAQGPAMSGARGHRTLGSLTRSLGVAGAPTASAPTASAPTTGAPTTNKGALRLVAGTSYPAPRLITMSDPTFITTADGTRFRPRRPPV